MTSMLLGLRAQTADGKKLMELTKEDLIARIPRDVGVEMAAAYGQDLHSLIRKRAGAARGWL